MVILHIAKIDNSPYSGVCVVVPKHVMHQADFATVGLMNVHEEPELDAINDLIEYTEPFDINNMAEPFNKPDLVVFHEVYKKKYLALYKNLKKNNIPYIIVPHGSLTETAQKKKWLKKKTANALLFNQFIKSAKAIQCLSETECAETKFEVKKFIGTNGIDIPEKKKEHFSEDGLKLVYIGRYDIFHKGIDLMLNAISSIADFMRENRITLDMYGFDYEGGDLETKNLISSLNIEDIVSFHGAITGKEKEDVLLDSDIFIQTSRFEGMPLGILEALSYGLPCIVTEGTNLRKDVEYVGAGWSAGDNSNTIAKTIKKAFKGKALLPEKSAKAIKLSKTYGWDRIAEDTVNNYRVTINE